MFCPRCAAQNVDDAKFCRVCGANLETVALALADNYQPTARDRDSVKDPFERWLRTRRKGVNKIATGIGLVISSFLIGVALWLFSGNKDWIIIWTVLVGWMTCFGVISMLSGITVLMESRFLRRHLGKTTEATTPPQSLPVGDRAMMNEASTAPISQSSVTEHTTTRLIKPKSPSERAS